MPIIRPCADLRNKYNEISKICHETKEPMYITKNGANDLVVLSNEAFEKMMSAKEKIEQARIEDLIEKHFDKHYSDFEEFKEDLLKKINEALEDVEKGNIQSLESFCGEMEEKYDLH